MKKLLFITLIAVSVLASCSSAQENEKHDQQLAVNSNTTIKKDVKTDKKGKVIHLNKEQFLKKVMNFEKNTENWVYEGDLPCIIDFYADWCGPCRKAAPILDEIAKEYDGKIYVYKIDTQKERELAAAFNIKGIPAFLYVPMKGKPQMTSGIGRTTEATKNMFKKNIEEILLKK